MRRQCYKYWKVYLGGKTKLTNNAKINTFLRQAVTWHEWRQKEVRKGDGDGWRGTRHWAAWRTWICCLALGAFLRCIISLGCGLTAVARAWLVLDLPLFPPSDLNIPISFFCLSITETYQSHSAFPQIWLQLSCKFSRSWEGTNTLKRTNAARGQKPFYLVYWLKGVL